ncbi:chromosome segregation protein SMC [Macrococcus brunensis]|uniref:Chromosome partition protein Smc n=1 Tax=Macrococcus brunensis TaxID=198483 RepID=A0A4R6BFQ4_9STAP|nr:chromosome segregation protein SMC [Macrococcus brunensis]TDL98711.1 chromosome segregation protein SMC [Macrococcus brunensis]
MVYLKTVEAYGFKSFADKTKVEFDQGLTAIIGPNGSGKSNITDAIRWVLGEQSAKSLRGARMEDVIFSGTEKRQALNYAEVTLKLDNSDRQIDADAQLNITRRLYRSGESEYFINQTKSRLKDITELFLDTGLGKESFSMISQGKVDEILNAKPEDRRHLIEEAAGVLKYKKRKKETASKLDETMLNLSRVNDIIFDLEARVEPLAIESATAEEHQALTQEMTEADIQVTVTDIQALKTEYARLDTEIKEFNDMILIKKERADKLEKELSGLNDRNTVLTESQDSLNQQRLELSTQLERQQGRLSVLYEKQDNQSQAEARQKKELQKLESERQALQQADQKQSGETAELQTELKQVRQEERSAEKKLTELNSDVTALIESARDQYYQVLSEQTSARNELKYIEKELTALERYFTENQTDSHDYQDMQREHEVFEDKLKQLEKDLMTKRTAYKECLADIQTKQTRYRELDDQLRQGHRYLDKLKSKYQSLTAMQSEYQGYYQGVRLVLREKLEGIYGAVAELIDIDSKYQTALDIALGGQLQSIVTEDETSARAAIQFLKKRKGGRATFLPLSTIQPKVMADSMLNRMKQLEGYVGQLSNLITVDPKYASIVRNLTGLVVVAEDLESANNIARQTSYKFRIVTLDGNIVNPGGSMTGGSVNQPSILLRQKEELEQVSVQLSSYQEQLSALENEFNSLKSEITDAEIRAQNLQSAGEELAEEERVLKQQRDEHQSRLYTLKAINQQHEERLKQKNEYETTHQRLNQSISENEVQLKEIEQQITDYQLLQTDARSIEKEVNATLAELRQRKVILEERLKYQRDKQQTNEERLKQVRAAISDLEAVDELNHIEEKIAALKEEIKQSEEKLSVVTQQFDQDRRAAEEVAAGIREQQVNYNELMRQLNNLENGVGEMKGQYSRIDVQLESLIYHLMEDYHMTFEAAENLYPEPTDIDAARKRVKLTKLAIEELGPVNPNAIQQYKEVKERYDFLSEQETDLLSAKDTLETIMKEMDDEVTARFNETFSQVQSNFAQVFSELFGGGNGEIKLNSDDVLTAGLDIVVEPPGKKRQHLTLLSGGERALTAVALLFAILKVRTAPFVILDEVEAALDEANVLRFGQYVKTLSHDTQFIVITHRKGTMEAADRLYGVTMQNSGITQMVSVDLNELNHNEIKELTK